MRVAMLKTSSKIVNRCSLPALPKPMGIGRFLNQIDKNIEQGLTSDDVRSIWKNPFSYIALGMN